MIIDDSTDCEDQGFTNLDEGCLRWECQTWDADTAIHPQFVKKEKNGHVYWVCPKCNGYYGEVDE